jgi:hypothetical protein
MISHITNVGTINQTKFNNIGNSKCATRHNTTQNVILRDAQHVRHLNTLTDTIRWLITSTGRYANMWGYIVDRLKLRINPTPNFTATLTGNGNIRTYYTNTI